MDKENKKKNNILILTLGTGKLINDGFDYDSAKLKELRKKQAFGYKPTTYRMEMDGVEKREIETEYVAELLMKHEKRDKIIILGTVKSLWLLFFLKFIDQKLLESEDEQNRKKVREIADYLYEKAVDIRYGKDTSAEELQRIQSEITQFYKEMGVCKEFLGESGELKVVLTKYGMNQRELDENYEIITKQLEKVLEKDCINEISIDITHSFRSLPIYNLAVVEYYKNITDYDVDLKHIYYGNVDVVRETKVAPVVDLGSVFGIMKLSGGVKTFKNTGSVTILKKEIENYSQTEERDDLLRSLEYFDYATQLNEYKGLFEQIKEMMKLTEKISEGKGKLAGLCRMLNQVFLLYFSEERWREAGKYEMARKQYYLSKWYFDQNRIGLASTTILECLRSALVQIYMQTGMRKDSEEKNRRNSLLLLKKILRLNENQDEKDTDNERDRVCSDTLKYGMLSESVRDVISLRKKVAEIRNHFAHNLEYEKEISIEDFQNDRNTINEFIEMVGRLIDLIVEYETDIVEVCQVKKKEWDGTKKIQQADKVRILISKGPLDETKYTKYKRSNSRKNSYIVYQLPTEIRKLVNGNKDEKNLWKQEHILKTYLEEYFNERKEKLEIYFQGISPCSFVYMATALSMAGFKNIHECFSETQGMMKQIDLGVEIPYLELDENSMQAILSYPPEECV